MANVKFLNPFVEAASEVLQAEAASKVIRGTLTLHKASITADDITVLLSLVGQVQGVVLFGLSIETALGLVSKITGQAFTEFNTLAQSGVAEMGNVITGRATVKLSETGFNSVISPPTLIVGKGIQISTLDFARIMVPLQTDFGEITVHLAVRESPPGLQDKNFVPITVS